MCDKDKVYIYYSPVYDNDNNCDTEIILYERDKIDSRNINQNNQRYINQSNQRYIQRYNSTKNNTNVKKKNNKYFDIVNPKKITKKKYGKYEKRNYKL